LGLIRRTASLVVRRDLAVDPDFDYYVAGPDRRPLQRVRTAMLVGRVSIRLAVSFAAAVFVVLMFLVGTALTTAAIGALVCFVVTYVAVWWWIPGYRWNTCFAENLSPGMWVAVQMHDVVGDDDTVGAKVRLTQVLEVFEYQNKEFRWYVGLHSGAQWHFKPEAEVPVFDLVDHMPLLRWPIPVEARFDDLELPIVAVLEILWNESTEVPVDAIINELAKSPWSEDRVFEAMDAAWRLGMANSRGRGKRLDMSDAGEVWFCAWSRRNGVELIPDAKERLHVNILNDGIMQFGDQNQAAMASNHASASTSQVLQGISPRDLAALQQLLQVLAQPEVRAHLHDDALATVDDETDALARLVERRAPLTAATRKSIKTILGVAGQLIIGAAGNGFYDMIKQMVT
jgi:hypothetical protein